MNYSKAWAKPESLLFQTNNVRALMITNHHNDDLLQKLATLFSSFEELGINALILEVDYHFAFKSYPALQHPKHAITLEGAQLFAKKAKQHGITVIPLFHVLGNQSKGKSLSPLLAAYPEFDATPGYFTNNRGIHTREWDPLNEQLERIIFASLEELVDAFSAPALHIGMGEIFLLGHQYSPSTRNNHPAVLFAYVTNVYRQFLVYSLNVSVLMFADRLIDGMVHDFGPWESSYTGSAAAIDLIPRDIVICPLHFKPHRDYPSIPTFTQRGFRILPTCWNDSKANKSFIEYCLSTNNEYLLGFMFSTANVQTNEIPVYTPLVNGLSLIQAESTMFGT
ncbi:MAG: hypothetical protein KTR29_00685 [Rhodothermaceae bacterium]|nr:hypothetical protein [Rhodothermaceae bacterium]